MNQACKQRRRENYLSRCAAFSALGFVACASGGRGGGGVKEVGYRCGGGGVNGGQKKQITLQKNR